MIYGYEQPVQYTPVEVFNPTTANMVLQSVGQYAQALQLEHERALQEEKDFLKEYGDFYSAVPGATEAYYNESVGKVRDAILKAQEAGIDLTRSAEGRAALHRIITGVNIGKLKQLQQQKVAYEDYKKSLTDAVAKGLITPEQAARKMEWDGVSGFTATDRMGNINQFNIGAFVSPFENSESFIDRTFGGIKDTYIGQVGAFDVNGVGREKLTQALGTNLEDWLHTDGGRYAFEQYVKNTTGVDMRNLSKEDYAATFNNKDLYNGFGNQILNQAAGKYEREQHKLNELDELREGYRLKNWYDEQSTNREEQKAINVYKATHPKEFDNDGNPINNLDATEQSYARDMYDSAIGKIFGIDMYSASAAIADGSAGKQIFDAEHNLLKSNNYDTNKCIAAHTVEGNVSSNAEMVNVAKGGSFGKGQGKVTLNSKTQFLASALGGRKIYDASSITWNTAGYAKNEKTRDDEQEKNYELLNSANYFTVTSDVVGHLCSAGQFRTYVRVIADNGAIGYIRINVDSNKKHAGLYYSSISKDHNIDLGYDKDSSASIKQRDLIATKLYTKSGGATNDGAIEPEVQ